MVCNECFYIHISCLSLLTSRYLTSFLGYRDGDRDDYGGGGGDYGGGDDYGGDDF